jgi:hypothetical protein
MEELKTCVRRYRDLDNQIRDINKNVGTLREKRKIVELEIADFLKSPQFSQHSILALEDGSKINIQRPAQWSKPWSLSKKSLEEHLTNYFALVRTPNAKECLAYVIMKEKEQLVANEFKLTRVVKDENIDIE